MELRQKSRYMKTLPAASRDRNKICNQNLRSGPSASETKAPTRRAGVKSATKNTTLHHSNTASTVFQTKGQPEPTKADVSLSALNHDITPQTYVFTSRSSFVCASTSIDSNNTLFTYLFDHWNNAWIVSLTGQLPITMKLLSRGGCLVLLVPSPRHKQG